MLDKSKLDKLIFGNMTLGVLRIPISPRRSSKIGSIAQKMHESGTEKIVTGRDGRVSSKSIEALRWLVEGGVEVLSVGQVPTPILYYATNRLNTLCRL